MFAQEQICSASRRKVVWKCAGIDNSWTGRPREDTNRSEVKWEVKRQNSIAINEFSSACLILKIIDTITPDHVRGTVKTIGALDWPQELSVFKAYISKFQSLIGFSAAQSKYIEAQVIPCVADEPQKGCCDFESLCYKINCKMQH